jgi:hypothetical protein
MSAGILMLTAGVFNVLWLDGVFTRILDIKELLRITWMISPFPYLILDIGFGGNNFIASTLALVFILGIFSGIIRACICVPLLGIAAVIIMVLSGSQSLNKKSLNQRET